MNQTAPSLPRARSVGLPPTQYSVICPLEFMVPILPTLASANHMLPSAPSVIPSGPAQGVGTGYSVTWPLLVSILPTRLALNSEIHTLSSGPAQMSTGSPETAYSVIWPEGVILATLSPHCSTNH